MSSPFQSEEFRALSTEEKVRLLTQAKGPIGEQFRTLPDRDKRALAEQMAAPRSRVDVFPRVVRATEEQLKQGPGDIAKGLLGESLAKLKPSGEGVRSGMVGAGGLLGATLAGGAALPAGPAALPAMGAGGALGAAGGSLLADALGVGEASKTPAEGTRRALGEAAFEVGTLGVGAKIGPAKQFALRRITAVNDQMARIAERYGVSLGITDVSTNRAVTGFREVIGKFPIVSRPFVRAQERAGAQVVAGSQEMFDRVAPLASSTAVGHNMDVASRRKYRVFRDEVNRRYAEFRRMAEIDGSTVSPSIGRERATGVIESFSRDAPRTAEGEAVELTKRASISMAEKVASLADNITVKQYESMLKEIDDEIGKAFASGANQSASEMLAIREGLETDLLALNGSERVVDSLKAARSYYHEMMSLFERPVGQKFGKVDKRVFGMGPLKPGPRNPDQLVETVFDSGTASSPQAIRDLRRIVGPKAVRESTRLHLERVFEDAIEITEDGALARFNQRRFSTSLGLFDPTSPKREAFQEALYGSGVSVDEIEDFIRLVNHLSEQGPIDVSKFVQRRAVLGGFRSAVRTFTPAAGTGGGDLREAAKTAAGSLAFLVGGRRLGNFLTDPRALKLARGILSPTATEAQRRAMLLRLDRFFPRDNTPGTIANASAAAGVSSRAGGYPLRGVGTLGLSYTGSKIRDILPSTASDERLEAQRGRR